MLHYNEETGIFTWIESNRASVNGTIAGSVTTGGYITIYVNGKTYPAHRLAWFYVTRLWPKEYIDHIDHDPENNRWINLREANKSQNGSNTLKINKGVRRRSSGRWEARIRVDKKEIYIGSFASEERARVAFAEACNKYRGEFARA